MSLDIAGRGDTRKRPYMRFYVRDFLLDEAVDEMDLDSVGAYVMVLCRSWMSSSPGEVPAHKLRSWARCLDVDDDEWLRMEAQILRALQKSGDKLVQKRMVAEYERMMKDARRKMSSRMSAKSPNEVREKSEPVSANTQTQTHTQTKPKNIPSGIQAARDSWFKILWDEYPRKVGKSVAAKSWDKHAKTAADGHSLDALGNKVWDSIAVWCRYWEKKGTATEYVPHLSTWLNQRRFEEVPE
jgi:uncharacterized protein YdaU (DUF1376 family)